MYDRPGKIVYLPAGPGVAVQHGAGCKVGSIVGFAIKQKTPPWSAGYVAPGPTSPQTTIAATEPCALKVKGVGQVAAGGTLAAAARFTPVYIDATNVLTTVSTSNTKFGLLTEIAGDRGWPTGFCRIDLDLKSLF